MTKIYDYVFVTHLPAFYKINLYNKLADQLSILVIFISGSSLIRTQDFVQNTDYRFDHLMINSAPFEQRSKFKSSLKFIKILSQIKFKKIILGGWDLLEFWLAWGLVSQTKLSVAIESSIHESKTTGPKSWLKKIFVSKLSSAYVSGIFQKNLAEQLDFKQVKIITGGVGLIHPPKMLTNQVKLAKKFSGRFLYLGRLSSEKNIGLLIQLFTEKFKNYHLTLAGTGPLDKVVELEIKQKNITNVSLLGHVPNSEISALFYEHDVLILPSQQEPWGLVVEEAIAYGLPVIVSNKVGCHPEIIKHKINGYVFRLDQNNSEVTLSEITESCYWVAQNYVNLVENIGRYPEFDWRSREKNQIAAYIN